jgi:hypothetical protein
LNLYSHAFYSWSFAPRRLEVALELPLCVGSLRKFELSLCDSEQLKVGLCDHLREERVERDLALCELLNEDIGFFVNLNLGIKSRVSLVLLCLLHLLLLFTFLLSLACDRSPLLS